MTSRLRTSLILLVLFLAAWLPRVVALDAFVTVDERKWLTRAANFTYALATAIWRPPTNTSIPALPLCGPAPSA